VVAGAVVDDDREMTYHNRVRVLHSDGSGVIVVVSWARSVMAAKSGMCVGVESDGRRDGIVGLFVCPVAGKPRPQVLAEGDNGREEVS
jgi:hypothetical protein